MKSTQTLMAIEKEWETKLIVTITQVNIFLHDGKNMPKKYYWVLEALYTHIHCDEVIKNSPFGELIINKFKKLKILEDRDTHLLET